VSLRTHSYRRNSPVEVSALGAGDSCRTMEGVGTERPTHRSGTQGGEFGFDGGMRSRDACRAPLTRKTDGTSVNRGYSVRSRCLISSDVRPDLAWWLGVERH